MKIDARKWLCGSALLLVLAVVACASSGTFDGDITVGPVTVRGSGSVNGGGHGEATNDSNKCFEVRWYDNGGHEVGSTTLTPGANHGPVPAGATNYTAVEKPCPPSSGSGGMAEGSESDADIVPVEATLLGSQARDASNQLRSLRTYNVLGGPIVFDDQSPIDNAAYEFNVRATSVAEALAVTRQALESRIGVPIDSRISIVTWLRAQQTPLHGTLVSLARSPFTELDVDLNGTSSYADLTTNQNAVQSQLGNGLWMVEANVSLSDLNLAGEWNRVTVRQAHGGSAGTRVSELALRRDP